MVKVTNGDACADAGDASRSVLALPPVTNCIRERSAGQSGFWTCQRTQIEGEGRSRHKLFSLGLGRCVGAVAWQPRQSSADFSIAALYISQNERNRGDSVAAHRLIEHAAFHRMC